GRQDGQRDVRLDHAGNETRIDGTTGARPGLGNREAEIHLPAARVRADDHKRAHVEPPRNQANYRIKERDELGKGSLKQKYQTNIKAIRLLRTLEKESRSATVDEKSILVKYVGWGGIPQVFDPISGRGCE